MPRPVRLAALAGTLLLAACSGGDADAPPADANTVEAPIVNDMELENMIEPVAPPSATPTPTPVPTPVATPTADEAQVQDDADASGMTARVSRDDAAQETTAPAEGVEKK